MNRAGAAAALAIAAACWGSLSVTTTIALRGMGPMTLLVGELTVAVCVLAVAARARGYRLPRPGLAILALGGLEPAAAFLAFDVGVQHTSSSHAGLLLSLETVFVVLLGATVLGERLTAGTVGGVALAVSGVVVLAAGPTAGSGLAGDGLVLLDTLAAAVSVVLTARLVRRVAPVALTTVQFGIGLLVVLPVAATTWIIGGRSPLPDPGAGAGPMVALVLAGSLGTACPFLLSAWALTRVSASAAGGP